MIEFLSLYAADIIVSLIILAAIGAAGMKIYKDRKKAPAQAAQAAAPKTDADAADAQKILITRKNSYNLLHLFCFEPPALLCRGFEVFLQSKRTQTDIMAVCVLLYTNLALFPINVTAFSGM